VNLARRRPLVLVYHRIAPATADRWSLAVSPEAFERQLYALRRFFRPVSLTALLDALVAGNARGCVAVTFDDGYADNLLTAMPLLEKYAVPATFFISSDPVERGREFWWDDLERMSDLAPAAWSFFSEWSGESTPAPQDESSRYLTMWRALSALRREQRDPFLDQLHARLGLPTQTPDP
jgi:peptidoglycan/xylan/chitin deacetylase (PgdA/CDA1 family)